MLLTFHPGLTVSCCFLVLFFVQLMAAMERQIEKEQAASASARAEAHSLKMEVAQAREQVAQMSAQADAIRTASAQLQHSPSARSYKLSAPGGSPDGSPALHTDSAGAYSLAEAAKAARARRKTAEAKAGVGSRASKVGRLFAASGAE